MRSQPPWLHCERPRERGKEGKLFCARCSTKQSVLKDGSAKRLEDFKEKLPNNIFEDMERIQSSFENRPRSLP
ncbi:hypothetical protein CDAR_87891 [Caerostris darwini]|uniref:Uncharacterized protein n=1 Tax=Caerostris darwini TaxID=1538125 RepID=A0AAV4S7P0_9ARAC|nr:hypothetical protein CDAR_87891 [Caerostris darwini]